MAVSDYKKVCRVSDIKQGQMKGFSVNNKQVLVANVKGKFYAINAICNHARGYLPDGRLEGKTVICPVHHCKFDLTTGKLTKNLNPVIKMLTGTCKDQETLDIKVEKGYVMVRG